MLCHTCQNQSRCLPAQFAQADVALAAMLEQLQDCGLQVVSPNPPSLWDTGRRLGQFCWQSLRRWGQR